MAKGNFADRVALRLAASTIISELDTNWELLQALTTLRRVDAKGAVNVTLRTPALQRLRLSWGLFDALVASDGLDPDDLLSEVDRWGRAGYARSALFGHAITHGR